MKIFKNLLLTGSILCVLFATALTADAAETDAADTTPSNWIIDFVDDSNSTVKPPNNRTALNVWLFPGDTLTFVHADSFTPGENGRVNSYTIGAQIDGSALGVAGHLETETVTMGTANTDRSATFITKLTCVGTQPVFIYQAGSGAKSTDTGIAYYSMDMGYRLADASVPVEYVYYDTSGNVITDEAYYCDGVPATSLLASDCTATTYCPGTNKVLDLTHPYIEGYEFKEWKILSAANDSDQSEYTVTLSGSYSQYAEHDGEKTGQTLTWTLNANPNNSAVDYGNGQKLVLKAIFYTSGHTLKLDACGGTIAGYAQRIYEDFAYKSYSRFNLTAADDDRTITATPERDGYIFEGWYTDTTYSTQITDLEELKANGSYPYKNVLYAKWTPKHVHTYVDVITKATVSADGQIVKQCSGCGEIASTTVIKKASGIKLSATSFTYNGKVQRPTLIKNDSGGNAIATTNYTPTWSNINSKAPGTYTLKLTFKGNYSGTKTLTYKILKQSSSVTLTAKTATYTGKAIAINKAKVTGSAGKVTYVYYRNAACTLKTGTTLATGKAAAAGGAPTRAGTYYVKATVAADTYHYAAASKAVKLVINKAANSATNVTASKTYKYSTLKKNAQSFTIAATVKESAKKTFVLSSVPTKAKKYITVSSAGKVTIKKGLAKGTYTIKVKITAAATTNYKATAVVKAIKIVVK